MSRHGWKSGSPSPKEKTTNPLRFSPGYFIHAPMLVSIFLACTSISSVAQVVGTFSYQMPAQGGVSLGTGFSTQPSSFAGSVPEAHATPGALPLSFADAIQRGLKQNLGVLLAGENMLAAR